MTAAASGAAASGAGASGAGASGAGANSLLNGVDADALIGAFAGAALVVATSQDLSLSKRIAYLGISWIAGYLAAPEVVRTTPIRSTGVAGFLAAALAIAVTLQMIERIRKMNIRAFFRKD
ncbi:putative holin [Robbsia sp. Bb-Pol-6]|uniref:Holin n=1 Tax=Robbsia betulipollinis TaxID=2981849 RepID=A0ABT3ZRB8_9BURK|nr:putative holin [Robbsia betulipollinis]